MPRFLRPLFLPAKPQMNRCFLVSFSRCSDFGMRKSAAERISTIKPRNRPMTAIYCKERRTYVLRLIYNNNFKLFSRSQTDGLHYCQEMTAVSVAPWLSIVLLLTHKRFANVIYLKRCPRIHLNIIAHLANSSKLNYYLAWNVLLF